MAEEGPVTRAIRASLTPGQTLFTPTARAPFRIEFETEGVVLLLGKGEHRTRLSWDCLDGVVPFIASAGGNVRIGGLNDVEGNPGTLDEYLKGFTTTNTAGWVAALLEAAGILELIDERPARVRIRVAGVENAS
ncbi:MAG: hypothetical protein ACKV2T_37995 [Kofleriaceae bacterium]